MPVHDWSRVNSGIFHHFHQDWTIEIARSLNRGRLPSGYSAMAEQRAGGAIPDVLTLQNFTDSSLPSRRNDGGIAVLPQPTTRYIRRTDAQIDAGRGNRIVIRHGLGRVVAAIEIMAPGNKESRSALRSFVEKTVDFLQKGIHVLIVDLFPPTARDPHGIHKAIWDEIKEEPFDLDEAKPLTLVSYRTGVEQTAFIELVGIGESLPEMPIYLTHDHYGMVPLETAYQATWDACPEAMRVAVETDELPVEDFGR